MNSDHIQGLATSIQQTSSTALEALQSGTTDVHGTAGPLADGLCQHATCPSSTSKIIGDLASALDSKLAYVEHLDPVSTATLSESMALIADAMKEALESSASSPLADQTAQGIGAYMQNLTFQLKESQSSSAIMHALRSFVPPLGPGSQGMTPPLSVPLSPQQLRHSQIPLNILGCQCLRRTCRSNIPASRPDVDDCCHRYHHGSCAIHR